MWLSHSWIIITIALVFNLLECHGLREIEECIRTGGNEAEKKDEDASKIAYEFSELIDEAATEDEKASFPSLRMVSLLIDTKDAKDAKDRRFVFLPSTAWPKVTEYIEKLIGNQHWTIEDDYNDVVFVRLSLTKHSPGTAAEESFIVKLHKPAWYYIERIMQQHKFQPTDTENSQWLFMYRGNITPTHPYISIAVVPYLAILQEQGNSANVYGAGLLQRFIKGSHTVRIRRIDPNNPTEHPNLVDLFPDKGPGCDPLSDSLALGIFYTSEYYFYHWVGELYERVHPSFIQRAKRYLSELFSLGKSKRKGGNERLTTGEGVVEKEGGVEDGSSNKKKKEKKKKKKEKKKEKKKKKKEKKKKEGERET